MRSVDESLAFDSAKGGGLKSHVKREVYREKTVNKLPAKARLIQAYSTESDGYCLVQHYQAWSKALMRVTQEEHIIDGIKWQVQYAAGMSHADIAAFVTDCDLERQQYPCSFGYERDGVNWDASRQTPVMDYLCGVYTAIDKELGAHARAGIHCEGKVKFKNRKSIRYHVSGTRKSGHMDTSSGNSADDIESAYQSVRQLPADILLALRVVRGLVLGDDLWLMLYFSTDVDMQRVEASLIAGDKLCGIEPEARCFRSIMSMSFISLSFYPNFDGTWAAGPKLGRLLSGLFYTHKSVPDVIIPAYRNEIAQAFLPLYGTCPLVGSWLRQHCSRGHVAKSFLPHYLGLLGGGDVDWSSYLSNRYNLLPGWEDSICRQVRHLKYGIVQCDAVDRIIDTDLCDLADRTDA